MGEGAIAPPDLLTIAIAIDPSVGEFQDFQVFVETSGQYTRGMTVFDRRWNKEFLQNTHINQMRVCLAANQKKYGDVLIKTLIG